MSASPSASLHAARNASVDSVRFAAAIVIVLFHAKLPVGWLMSGAMGFFTATIAFYAASYRDLAGQTLLPRRIHRLLRPFLIWGGIYGLLRLADALRSGNDALADIAAWLPPNGTMGQLWFLPFAFVVSQGVASLRGLAFHPIPHAGPLRAAVVTGGTALLAGLWLWLLSQTDMPVGWRVFLNYVPSVFFGAAAGLLSNDRQALAALGLSAPILALGLLAAGVGGAAQLAIGTTALIACLLWPGHGSRLTRLANALSLPVYLVHVLVIAVLLRIIPAPIGSPAFALATLTVTVLLSYALMRTRAGRLLF